MATMQDVAAAAGVSTKTVSRVVNREPGVREETAARVRSAIATMGFRPNAVARSLRAGHALPMLGLLIGDLGNPFYSGIAHGVEEVAAEHGYLVVSGSSEERAAREHDLVATLCRQHIAGLLVVPAGNRTGDDRAIAIPTVFIDRPAPGRDADCVLLDNLGGAQQGTSYLVMAGHRRIGVVGDDAALYTASERLAGYRKAFAVVGLPYNETLIVLGAGTVAAAEGATQRLLDLPQPPSAIFAMNNRACVGVLRAVAARRTGTAVLGFDDLELAELIPSLDALIVHDPVEMGRTAARILFARLAGEGGPPQTIMLPTRLVIY